MRRESRIQVPDKTDETVFPYAQ